MLPGPLGAAPEAPTPDQGTVGPGGKFNPTRNKDESGTDGGEGASGLKDLNIERLESGLLRIGGVTLDQSARTLRFQASVKLTKGPVEYLVVTETGKIHESVFMTKASPRDIHLGMLLLGVKPGKIALGPDRTLSIPDASAVVVSVEWDTNGPRAIHPLAAMVSLVESNPDEETDRTMSVGKWLYKGSHFDRMGFVAQREGSVISLIGDGAALVNNPGTDRDHDDIHVPNAKLLPREGMPVTIVVSVPGAPPNP